MKRLLQSKPIRISLAVLLGLFIATFVVVLNPAFQRWVLLGQLSKQFPIASLERVAAGPFSLEIRGLHLADTAWELRLGSLEVSYSPWAVVWRHLKVKSLRVNALELSVSELEETDEEEDREPWERLPGILELTETGWRLSLNELEVDAHVNAPGMILALAMDGGGLAPEATGVFHLRNLSLTPEDEELAGFRELRVTGKVEVAETKRGALDSLSWDLKTVTESAMFDQAPRLRIAGEVKAGQPIQVDKKEKPIYPPERIRLEVWDVADAAAHAHAWLLKLDGTYDAPAERLEAEFHFQADNAVLNPFAWALDLPEFRGEGDGHLHWDLATMTGESAMKVSVGISALERVSEVLATVGEIRIEERHRLQVSLDQVVLEEMLLRVDDAGGTQILALATTRPLTYSRLEHEDVITGMDDPWLSLDAEVPVEWFDGALMGFTLRGGSLKGRLDFTGSPLDKLVVSSPEALHATGETLWWEDLLILQGLDVSMSPRAEVEPDRVRLGVDHFTIDAGSDSILSAGFTAEVSFGGDLPFVGLLDYNLEFHPHTLLKLDAADALSGEMAGLREQLEEVAQTLGLSRLEVEGRVRAEPDKVMAESLTAEFASYDGSRVFFDVRLLEPVGARFSGDEISLDTPQKDWLMARIDDFPLSVVALFLEGWRLEGGSIRGAFTLGAGEMPGGFVLNFSEPLQVDNFAFGLPEELWLEGMQVSLKPAAFYHPDGLELSINEINLSGNGETLLDAVITSQLTLEQWTPTHVDFSLQARAWPVPLFKQPLLAPWLLRPWETPWHSDVKVAGWTDGEQASLKTLSLTMAPEDGENWVAFAVDEPLTLSSFQFEQPEQLLDLVQGTGTLAVKAFPLSLPLALVDTGPMEIRDASLGGAFAWALREARAHLQTTTPWVMTLPEMRQDNSTLLRDLTLQVEPEVEATAHQGIIRLEGLSLRAGKENARPLAGRAEASLDWESGAADLQTFRLDLEGDLPPWFAQPVVPENAVTEGRMTLSGQMDENRVVELNSDIMDFSMHGEPPALKALRLRATATQDAQDRSWPGKVSLELDTAGGTSDSVSTFLWAETADGPTLQIQTEGKELHIGDLEKLASDFSRTRPAGPRPQDEPVESLTEAGSREKKESYEDRRPSGSRRQALPEDRPSSETDDWEEPPEAVDFVALVRATGEPEVLEADTEPFWSGFPASLTWGYLIHEVIYTQYLRFTEVGGGLHLHGEAIGIDDFSARFYEAAITANGGLRWQPEDHPKPYALAMMFNVRDFDLNTFFSELVPGEKARVEGLFRMTVEADGSFPKLETARNHVSFLFDLESLHGLFRAIPPNSRLAMSSSAAAATFGEVLSWVPTGGLGLGALSRLVASMREIPYNRVALRIERAGDLNIRVESMEVRSPEILIQGQGGIVYEEGVDLLSQRLDLTAAMDARGEMAAILSGLGLLGGDRLENGYWPGFQFRIWGDLEDPRSNFDRIVTEASTGTLTRNITNPFHAIWGNIKYRGTAAEPEEAPGEAVSGPN